MAKQKADTGGGNKRTAMATNSSASANSLKGMNSGSKERSGQKNDEQDEIKRKTNSQARTPKISKTASEPVNSMQTAQKTKSFEGKKKPMVTKTSSLPRPLKRSPKSSLVDSSVASIGSIGSFSKSAMLDQKSSFEDLPGFIGGPPSFLSLLGPSPSERRRESLVQGTEEDVIPRRVRKQSPSPAPSSKRVVRGSSSAPVVAARKTPSTITSIPVWTRRGRAATAPLPTNNKNVTTIRIGPRKKASVGFMLMAADLREREEVSDTSELVSSGVMGVKLRAQSSELRAAMRRKPEHGQYKDLQGMLQVRISENNIVKHI